MKARSIKVADDQWERWSVEAAELGVDRSTYIRMSVDAFAQYEIDAAPQALAEAQALLDAKTEEIGRLKRELGEQNTAKALAARTNLPGLARQKTYVCSQCQKLNSKGRCIEHPQAKQKLLSG